MPQPGAMLSLVNDPTDCLTGMPPSRNRLRRHLKPADKARRMAHYVRPMAGAQVSSPLEGRSLKPRWTRAVNDPDRCGNLAASVPALPPPTD